MVKTKPEKKEQKRPKKDNLRLKYPKKNYSIKALFPEYIELLDTEKVTTSFHINHYAPNRCN